MSITYAPGARVVIRDAEWIIRKVDRTSTGGQALSVVGISEIVKDRDAIFLTEAENNIQILDPSKTSLVLDDSSSFQKSILYMESLIRKTPPTDERLYIGQKAVMDLVPYQLDPAIQALTQPRQRILVADAVGLGKTLEAGILLSELIRRGKGKRILVLTLKSMLTQFQKEMWNRFTIPLVRLDSLGLQRIRSQIPTNANPFYYYDKSIISIDTLKQVAEYRTYIGNAYWDIIVIDEAHKVAERNDKKSLRAKLANLLSHRSDTLIMLSATPHDGKARSFASLMNMLDATAIADPENYGPEDIKGLFVRRFKKDIIDQVRNSFQERQISVLRSNASSAEEKAFAFLTNLEFSKLDIRKSAGSLFKTTLEKSLFSSPAACIDTINNKIKSLQDRNVPGLARDIATLKEFSLLVSGIDNHNFSKYRKLLAMIGTPNSSLEWSPQDKEDRLVVFTERIETLNFLKENLLRDLSLREKQIEILHGGMSDLEQQRVVEEFGKEQSPVRILLASDVASEGINLHYLSHRMIHFDIPWSLLVFQQRNGRIDRYGQTNIPQIYYLVTESTNEKIKGDTRILELLIKKDKQAMENIGDPSAFMGVYDQNKEEKKTAEAIEQSTSVNEFEKTLDDTLENTFDPLSFLMGESQTSNTEEVEDHLYEMPSFFNGEYEYIQKALKLLNHNGEFQYRAYPDLKRIDLTIPKDLKNRFSFLPKEIYPQDNIFAMSASAEIIEREIKDSRKEENAWPKQHYLWPLNPVSEWVDDKLLAAFGRHEAPVLVLKDCLGKNETVYILSGLIPNRKGQPLVHRWAGVVFNQDRYSGIEDIRELLSRTGLARKQYPNSSRDMDLSKIQMCLPNAINHFTEWMVNKRKEFENHINKELDEHLKSLDKLKNKQYHQLEIDFHDSRLSEKTVQDKKNRRKRQIDELFDEYMKWIEETMTTEKNPYIQVVAVLRGE